MRVGRIALLVGAVTGGMLLAARRFREAPANLRRYSMPSVGTYDLATRLFFGGRYDEIASAIASEAPEGATVVDLGCGPGGVLLRVAALTPTLHLTGVDVDPQMIARARHKAERAYPAVAARPSFVVADAAALPFDDATVDLVVSSYAVHHLPDRHAARAEILRVLKPGGRALIWDIVSPHGAAETEGHAASGHGGPGHRPRMLLTFARTPVTRYELVMPGTSPVG